MGHTVNTLSHILKERAAFPNRAAWRAHTAKQRQAARKAAETKAAKLNAAEAEPQEG